jgi:uncharacterized protein involved in propanediol utilization
VTTPSPNGTPHGKNAERAARVGKGRSIAQHGELFQGQIEDETNRRRRCLLSLPCKALYSEATFEPNATGVLTVQPEKKQKAKRAAELTIDYLNAPPQGGSIRIESNVPEAKGYGSSTADCVAAAMAAADALGCSLSQKELGQLVVRAEIASDNFMFHRAVLFAHREGVVLEDYAQDMPKLEVLGVDTAEEDHVKTLEYPPAAYSWRQIQSFRTLASALRRAIRLSDIHLLGRVATASAAINQLFLPKPTFKDIRRIAECVGALGVAVAHSGTVLSILLDPNDDRLENKIKQLHSSLEQLGISRTLRFQT